MLKKIITRLINRCKTLLKIRATIKSKYQCMEFSLPLRLTRFSLAMTRVNIFIYLICIPCTGILISNNSYAVLNSNNTNLATLKPYFIKTKLIDAKAIEKSGHILPNDKKDEKFYKPFNIFYTAGITPKANDKYALVDITYDITNKAKISKDYTSIGYLVKVDQFATPIKTYPNKLAVFKFNKPLNDNKDSSNTSIMLSIKDTPNINKTDAFSIIQDKPISLPNNTKVIDIINPKSNYPSVIINKGESSGIKNGMKLASAKYSKCKKPPCLDTVSEHSTINKSVLIYQTTRDLSLGLIINNNNSAKVKIGDPIINKP